MEPEDFDFYTSQGLFAGLLLILCVRIMNIFVMMIPKVGAMQRICILIAQDVISYLFCMTGVILTFSIVFNGLFFYDVEEFESFMISFRTLFDFMIGNVDFSLFKDETGTGM